MKIRTLTGGEGVAAAFDGVGKSSVDASRANLAIRGTLALFGAASGPVPPFDLQRLNAAGSVYLTRPSRPHFMRTREEFAWRTGELFTAIAAGTIRVTVSRRYPYKRRHKPTVILKVGRPSVRSSSGCRAPAREHIAHGPRRLQIAQRPCAQLGVV